MQNFNLIEDKAWQGFKQATANPRATLEQKAWSLPEVYPRDLCVCLINDETPESSENSDRYAGK